MIRQLGIAFGRHAAATAGLVIILIVWKPWIMVVGAVLWLMWFMLSKFSFWACKQRLLRADLTERADIGDAAYAAGLDFGTFGGPLPLDTRPWEVVL